MKTLKQIGFVIVMLITCQLFSQQRTITGTVTDSSGPLPGVNVVVKGTQRGAQTEFDGKYSIKASNGETLVFSFMGMNDATRTIGDSNIINVRMTDNAKQLETVVVTALGISSDSEYSSNYYAAPKIKPVPLAKQDVSSKSPEVNPNDIISVSSNTFIDDIIQQSKKEYQTSDNPVFYINGFEISAEKLKKIDITQFSKIEIVKIEDAKKVFGKNANNGAILIQSHDPDADEKHRIRKIAKDLKKNSAMGYSLNFADTQESYTGFNENPFESPKTAPLSTFSIDVDNASYTNIRRFINNGQVVPKDAVRVEEMMNFFKYQYPQPKDDNPFSINTEYSDCPWNARHKLVKIGLQGKNISTETLPASNFVFLIDVSGSMSDANKLPLVKESLKVLVEKLRKEDKISIVVYAGAAGLVLPPTSGNQKETIISALEKLNAGGSTAGGAGIQLAYKTAEDNFIKGGNNRVVLATDGDFNIGMSSDGDMQTLIEEKRKSGVFLTCLGYGMGNYKDGKMEILADKGNGNYAYIDNIQEANRFLGKEFKGSMFAIAKDVKIQIEFNPKHVQSYRLIGYENRKLRPEDFKNDAIDAGELGSNHTVTALYEIIPTGVQSDFYPDTSELKYTSVEPSQNKYNDELATIKFRYKKPDGDKSIEMIQVIENQPVQMENSSDDFKFSSSVAWFGLKLRDSKLVTNKSSKEIEKLARLGLSNDTDGYKAEFIRLVEAVR